MTLTLAIGCNKPPEGGAVGITPEAPTTVDDLVAGLTVDPVDPNGNDLELTWSWTRNSVPADVTTETVPADLTSRGDLWEVTVTVSDGKELSLDELVASVVVVNTAPTAAVALNATELPTTEDLVATETVEDIDGDATTVSWTWTKDGTVQDITGPLVPASRTRKGEVWEVAVVAEDAEAESEPATASLSIVNSAPSVETATVAPDSAFTDTVLTCGAAGWSDADGDAEAYVFAWYVNDTVVAGAAESTLAADVTAKGDEVSCELTPTDGQASGTPVRSEAITIQNTAPVLDGVSIDPTEAFTSDLLTAVHVPGTDIDGDTLTASYAWTVDGDPAGTEGTLPAAAHAKGQQVVVTVTYSDGEAESIPVTSDAVTIANTPPTVTSASIEPTTVRTEDTVGVVSETDDLDGDEVTTSIVWLVNGARVATTATLDGTFFGRGDVITAEITPNDGDDDGSLLTTAGITVLNTAPGAPAISIDPGTPLVGAPMTCAIDTDAIDVDGDSLSYTATWTRNGSAYTGASTTTFAGDTIPASVTKDKDVWVCSVTASDGTDTGPSVTDSVTVVRWTGRRVFTSCAATGATGPSSSACSSAYSGSTLDGEVTVSGGIQSWTVPVTGTYRIEAWGAQGKSAQSGRVGGRGARMRGDLSLKSGETLSIVVGQEGIQNSCNGGGGGGSFVARSSTPLIIAGGGGGTREIVDQNGCDASTAQQAGTGSGSASTHGCGLKSTSTIGSGGIVSSSSWGSGGGAWSSNGAGEYDGLNGGRAFTNGANGGGTSSYLAYGGFGGGGAGNGSCGGGGGGGYSGGDGGRVAGAGGSYNVGSSQSNSAGARSGAGQVTIDLL